jgi:hypothetical protein
MLSGDDYPTFGDLVVACTRVVVRDHVATWGGASEVLRDLTRTQLLA